ncbi:MAG: NAD-dependent succinate-semialdehyde dehydrogenase [Acidobacteriota bacterium]
MTYRTLDPSTGELIESFGFATADEIEHALTSTVATFETWRATSHAERARLLERIAELLESRAEDLARIMALEMGKPLAQGAGEAKKCALVCRYYAKHGERFLSPEPAESDGSEAAVRFEPLGPILAIMPWNFPLWQVFRHAAPAFAAGNTVVLKHAPGTPRCAMAIEELIRDAGAPPGLLHNLFLSNDQAADVIRHQAIRGVTLTGSTRAGRVVGAIASAALKPLVLELGGSDPFIVFADADLDRAVDVAIASRCLNSGQSCIAAKRFLIDAAIFADFRERFVERMRAKPWGDPRDPNTEIGSLAREDLRDALHDQVERMRQAGGRTLCGGAVPDRPGFFYPPTVVVDLPPHADIASEELFGPVAPLFTFDDEDHAVTLANATDYGLGASLWTHDRARIERLIPRLDTGSVFVNGLVKSDPRLPFGGIKDSGIGRELGRDGIREFVNIKTVWVA